MELHPVLQILFVGIVGVLATIAVVWFYVGYGAWMDDASPSFAHASTAKRPNQWVRTSAGCLRLLQPCGR